MRRQWIPVSRSLLEDEETSCPQEEQQVPPLRFAPAGMTILLRGWETVLLHSAGRAVYLHYTSKDGLILAAVASYIQKLRELLLPILTRKDAFPPSGFVRELTKAIVSHTQRNDLDRNGVMLMVWREAQSNPKVKVKELPAGTPQKVYGWFFKGPATL